MKNSLLILSSALLFSILTGCSSSQVAQTASTEVKPAMTFQKEIKNVAAFDLPLLLQSETGKQLPEIITDLRRKVGSEVSARDIDAVSFVISEDTPDIIGHLAAEARLIKPYLIIGIEYKDNQSLLKAEKYRNSGVADIIVQWVSGKVSLPGSITLSEAWSKRSPRDVYGLDLSALFTGNPSGREVKVTMDNSTIITDSEGKIGFIASQKDTVTLQIGDKIISLATADWSVPFRYAITAGGFAERRSPWVEFRSMPSTITDRPDYDLLCKTDYPASVKINDDSVKQYKTGIFFNKVTFREGANRVRATIITPDSRTAFYENEFIFQKTDKTRKAFPLWISERTVEPSYDMELLPEDNVRISFQGSLAQDGYIEVEPGKIRIKCSREDFEDYSIYRGDIAMNRLRKGIPVKIYLKLVPASSSAGSQPLKVILKNSIVVRELSDFPFIKVAKDNSRLIYNLGAPRLGGPVRAEIGPGPVMKVNGKFGDNYRVRLSRVENGFINKGEVEIMPVGTVLPAYYITSMSCGPSRDADVLTIPYPEPVAYEIYPDPDQKRLVITLFGVETSSTWITHNNGRRIIDKVTWEQSTPETYRIFVNLNTPDIWGYSFRQEGKRLVLRVKYSPVYDLNNSKPLTGLKIAIEAGHGGSGLGAVGLSGLLEKNVNLDLALKLGDLLKSMGAEVVQARDSDKDMTLIEKRNIVVSSDADLFVSVHSNAGGGGYLRVGGTSTYYNNPFWAPLAETIYVRLLELKLKEFGVVGSFNYTPIRLSEMPSILVEQAFMSNAEDEERLADPAFRQQEAEKIAEGIVDYLRSMKK